MNRVFRNTTVAAGLALLAACGGTEEEPEGAADTEVVAEPAAPAAAGGMEGLGRMESMQQGGIAAQLQGHMQMMQNASGEELRMMLPEHRQLVANTIAQMNREMQSMDMSDNTDWNESVAALRQDLVRLPEMTPEELKAFIPEHQERINKLMDMHRSMLGDMKM